MLNNQTIGAGGETLAAEYLQTNGFVLLERNWRSGRSEIDIVARRKDELHFIEVKTRSSDKYGHPEQSIGKRKLQALMKAAEVYLQQHNEYKEVIFDVLSIITSNHHEPSFFLIEDVRP